MLIIAGTVLGGRLASLDLLGLVWHASWLVQIVIAMLVAASVTSWAAIIFKWRELDGARQDSDAFLDAYREGSVDRIAQAARELQASPLSALFLAAFAELKRLARYGARTGDGALSEVDVELLRRQISWVAADEMGRLESRLSFLATVGSASPFVGLFGTVVGIIDAFSSIGASGSASLAVVAPGIAEALIATAIGLLAAIPATIFYNLLVARLVELQRAVDLFASELASDVPRLSSQITPPARRAEG